ncbi:alpha/beta fold hydrolase [Uliginosibacterium sp. H3]|uniref:Alpha/beta fold hydrolase n=1 Tax=Uliginosibacterium silvisoli TaxID=3114758 RepID=A0ABU6K2L0_9RHOO|nr:alpha/beta fold hydrolase [Uliginosibacterium sp. H3]
MSWHRRLTLALALTIPVFHTVYAADSVETIELASGGTQKYAVFRNDDGKPVTRLMALFTGGDGEAHVGLLDGSPVFVGRGFMVDGRRLFLREGTAVAVIDSPSSMPKMAAKYRQEETYLAGTEKALDAFRAQFPTARLYLIGHSNGSISAMALASRMKERVAGVVSLGGVIRRSEDFGDIKLAQPILFMHHRKDACASPTYSAAFIDLYHPIFVEDIGAYFPSRCGPYSAHHFHGQEGAVVDTIYRWLNGATLTESIR